MIGNSGHHRQSQIRAGVASTRTHSPERRLRGSLRRNLATSPLPGCCTSVTGNRCFGRCHRGPRAPVLAEAGVCVPAGQGDRDRRKRQGRRLQRESRNDEAQQPQAANQVRNQPLRARLHRRALVGVLLVEDGEDCKTTDGAERRGGSQPVHSPSIYSRATRLEAEARRIRLAGADLEVRYES